ncbi:hypothetical protein NBRC116596_30760 [Litorivita sp. NS0012-18]
MKGPPFCAGLFRVFGPAAGARAAPETAPTQYRQNTDVIPTRVFGPSPAPLRRRDAAFFYACPPPFATVIKIKAAAGK